MIKPLKNHVLLEKILKDTKTTSGIVLSTKDETQENIATVTSFGNDVKDLKINDKVIFENYKGTNFTHKDKEYILIEDKHILAIIN